MVKLKSITAVVDVLLLYLATSFTEIFLNIDNNFLITQANTEATLHMFHHVLFQAKM